MKHINVSFEDSEHAALLALKGKMSWHDFVMSLVDGDEE